MQNELDITKKLEIIEAVLYAAGHPVTYEKLGDVLEVTPSVAKELVCMYEEKYNNSDLPRGIQLIRFDKACQLCTKSEYESQVKLALGVKQGRGNLSNSSLEVLAIIAYHQPVTRAYIDQVRGLDSSYSVALLMEKNLIEKKGRLDVPGRPSLYGTTLDFLRCFGLSSLDQLPSVEMLTFDTEEDNKNETENTLAENEQ
ncbi:MAG: SMC-Scp complex subunit ScpB [Ruminococcaceae bacterium]|nr:SMC-Scp complex subunit ScpB [Oscillospiraceae bacterium]